MKYHIQIISTAAEYSILFRGDLIKYLSAKGHRVSVACNDYTPETRKAIKRLGAKPVDHFLNRSGLNPFKDILATVRLIKQLNNDNIDIVLCHFVKPIIFGLLAARIAGVKRRVAMLEGLGWAFTEQPTSKRSYQLMLIKGVQLCLYRLALPLAHHLVFLNEDDLNTLKCCVQSTPVHRLKGIGVPETFFSALPPNLSPITFIFIGRLLRTKGIHEFVSAAKAVKCAHPDVRFIVLGEIDEKNPASLSRSDFLSLKESTAGQIEFVGYTKEVQAYLKQSSVLVLPSYREGSPRVVQEAMAMSRPVIVSDVPGCRQVVEAGVNGFVVPPFSSEAIVEQMKDYIQHPDKIVHMGHSAHRYAKTHFNSLKVSKKLGALLLN